VSSKERQEELHTKLVISRQNGEFLASFPLLEVLLVKNIKRKTLLSMEGERSSFR
jgi:hypothetical protein